MNIMHDKMVENLIESKICVNHILHSMEDLIEDGEEIDPVIRARYIVLLDSIDLWLNKLQDHATLTF